MKRHRRWLAAGVLLALVAPSAAGLAYVVRLAAIGIAYKAKMVCSAVFVVGLPPEVAGAAYDVDDLATLRYISTSVDRASRSVSASAFGLMTRRAVDRGAQGCALVPDGDTDAVPVSTPAASRPVRSPSHAESSAFDRIGPPGPLTDVFDRAFSEPDPQRPRRTQAVLIVERGRVVAERYAEGVGPDTRFLGWSMTKSVLNALVGMLVGQGRIAVDRPVLAPEWQEPGDPRSAITFDHLLRMSSGLRFDEHMADPLNDAVRMLFNAPDMGRFAAEQPLVAPPGTTWAYSSGASSIVARAIRRAVGDDAEYLEFPSRALFEPIGMTSAVLETDATGTWAASSSLYATARDWARFGLLYLRDGVWEGTRLLPAGWVAYSRAPAPADPHARYGAHFWRAVPPEFGGTAPMPDDAFHAIGHEGQFVTIVPSRGVVIVRLGRTRYLETWDHDAFVHDVLRALERSRSDALPRAGLPAEDLAKPGQDVTGPRSPLAPGFPPR